MVLNLIVLKYKNDVQIFNLRKEEGVNLRHLLLEGSTNLNLASRFTVDASNVVPTDKLSHTSFKR